MSSNDTATSVPLGLAGAEPTAVNPWARQGGATNARATNRLRKIVDGLPGWEPLPPGELPVVRRSGGS